MKTATITIVGVSPLSQSRPLNSPKGPKETSDDHEKRTWKERAHVDTDGRPFIPPMAFKNCLSEIAKFLSVQIPGKGKATYTKHFEAGILAMEPMLIDGVGTEIEGEWLYVPADGRRGGPKRVWKCFPIWRKWGGTVTVHVLDDTITTDIFEHHLREAGRFIGVGRFRPRNNGFYGRFDVVKIAWS